MAWSMLLGVGLDFLIIGSNCGFSKWEWRVSIFGPHNLWCQDSVEA
jgi:hypothetical protein